MKKQIYLLLLFQLLADVLFCQVWNIEWQQCFGGSETDAAYSLQLKLNGNIVVFCTTHSVDGDITFNHGLDDFWLFEADIAGNIIWERTYGGSDWESVSNMIKSIDGGYVMFGCTFSDDGDITNFQGGADYWAIKTDSAGNIEWDKCLGGSIGDNGLQIRNTVDSGYICVGYTCSSDGDVTGFNGLYDAWIVKLSSEGEIEWNKCVGGYHMDYGLCIRQTSDGGYVMGGWTLAYDSTSIICNLHSLHENDALVVKMDSAGNTEWQKCYGGTHQESASDIEQTSDSGYIFLGITHSNDGDVSGFHGTPGITADPDLWVVKLDHEGNIEWQKCLGGSNGDEPTFIRQMENGNYLVGSYTYSNDGDVSGHHSMLYGTPDIWLAKLSPEGDLLGQQCIGGNGSEIPNDVYFLNDKEFYLAGMTTTPDNSGDVDCAVFAPEPPGDAEVWILKLTDTTTGVSDEMEVKSDIKVYPNPAMEYVVFEFNKIRTLSKITVNTTIVLTNSFGQKVAELPVMSNQTVFDCRHLPPGIYFYQFQTNIKTYTGKFLIIK